MKKTIGLLALFCVFFQATVFAAAPDFSGVWELDVNRSTLPEAMAIEALTLKVTQTEKGIVVDSSTKIKPDQMRAGQIIVYNLDGKETIAETGKGTMASKETRLAKIAENNALNLTVIRSFSSENGVFMTKTNEIWELLDVGKTLKIIRYTESPRGAANAEMYFTKNDSIRSTVKDTREMSENQTKPADGKPKLISGGVLNGKAKSLPLPPYPAAAKAVGASGAVNVQVAIDEQGNVSSASAVSGHPLLRRTAEEAARGATFAPTLLNGVPVRITGVLVYNFTP